VVNEQHAHVMYLKDAADDQGLDESSQHA